MNEVLLSVYLSCFAMDGSTTHIAFAKYSGQVREVFMTQNPWVNDGLVAAQSAGLLWATKNMKNGWIKWSVRLGVAGVHGWAATHNIRETRKLDRQRR